MKRGKRFVSLMLALVMICSLMVNAGAAESQEEIRAYLNYDITVTYNGDTQTLKDAAGNTVYPVSYNGTTYLPVRAVSNMLGVEVEWDGTTQTVILSEPAGGRTAAKSGGEASTASGQEEIKAYLAPGITVKYNGKVQTMTDAAGNTVYPVSYNGTTYLPVRAVSNMLGIAVDWNGATQTVILGGSNTGADNGESSNEPAGAADKTKEGMWLEEVKIDVDNELALRTQLTMMVMSGRLDVDVSAAVDALITTGVYTTADGVTLTYAGVVNENKPKDSEALREFNAQYQTSTDAKVLGENHIGYDWAEIDWSHANDGYVRVKLNKEFTKYTQCSVNWVEDGEVNYKTYMISTKYNNKLGKWINIPLPAGNREYAVTIGPIPMDVKIDGNLSDEELDLIYSLNLIARFKAEMENANAPWLASTIRIDYENAPLTRAKALEITKNCKTDAEKITAVFNWVAKNIKYDTKLDAELTAWENTPGVNKYITPFKNGTREYLNLDSILNRKSGICEDFATLMVGMLRSVGVPCKYVAGKVCQNEKWIGHGWVAVSPDTEGLDQKALGAGTEADGWIRLDPTWGGTASGRAKASVDKNYEMREEY